MPASDGKGRQNISRRDPGRKDAPAGGKPVRLSDLAPPGGLPPPGARAGTPASPLRPAPADPASPPPRVPSRPPGPAPQTPGPARGAAPPADGVARLRADLQESQAARRRAEARVAELERELAALRGGATGAAAGTDGNGAELERLRRELEEAHAIIRAIEDAYLAGGGDPAPPTEPPAL